jgi:hypothetical protein
MDAFFKGFAEGFIAVPQLIGSSVGLVPPPAIFTQMKTDPQLLAPITHLLAPVTEVISPIVSPSTSSPSSSSGIVTSSGSSVVSESSSSDPTGQILGMDQNTALLVGGGVLLLLLLI